MARPQARFVCAVRASQPGEGWRGLWGVWWGDWEQGSRNGPTRRLGMGHVSIQKLACLKSKTAYAVRSSTSLYANRHIKKHIGAKVKSTCLLPKGPGETTKFPGFCGKLVESPHVPKSHIDERPWVDIHPRSPGKSGHKECDRGRPI